MNSKVLKHTNKSSSMEKVISPALEDLYEYYYFSPETYTDENNSMIPSKASGAY